MHKIIKLNKLNKYDLSALKRLNKNVIILYY